MEILRSIIWFEKNELVEITGKLFARKWSYEARWESEVLFALVMLIALGFGSGIWLGILTTWLVKIVMQALNNKRFFDPLP